jgi:hypothetical protein
MLGTHRYAQAASYRDEAQVPHSRFTLHRGALT